MRSSKIQSSRKAYKQGNMDGMCGYYSIINAIHYLDFLSINDAERIIRKMTESDKRFRGTYHNGMFFDKLQSLASVAVKASRRKIKLEAPYVDASFSNNTEFFNDLGSHLYAGSVAIVNIAHPWYHWTCITKVGYKKIHLFDSCFETQPYNRSDFTIFNSKSKKCIMFDDTLIFTPKFSLENQ